MDSITCWVLTAIFNLKLSQGPHREAACFPASICLWEVWKLELNLYTWAIKQTKKTNAFTTKMVWTKFSKMLKDHKVHIVNILSVVNINEGWFPTPPQIYLQYLFNISCETTDVQFHSFILSSHFILVRIMVDPESILGTLAHKVVIYPEWDVIPSQGTMYAHINTLIHTLWQFNIVNPLTGIYSGNGRNPENLEETHTEIGRLFKTS